MKPILRQYLESTDCTTIALKDASVIPNTLPSYLVLKVSTYDKDDSQYILINSNTDTSLTEWLGGAILLLNSFLLGKTMEGDKLVELNCGLIRIEYHWFYTTSKTISYTKGSNILTGVGLDIKDSVYIGGETYTINKIKSIPTKLVTNEPLLVSGATTLVYGEYDVFYFINECSIQRGLTLAIGNLSVLDCETSDRCLGSEDKTKTRLLLDDFIKLQSAKVKLKCGDFISANYIIQKLCNSYASACYNADSLISNCGCQDIKVQQGCTTCDG